MKDLQKGGKLIYKDGTEADIKFKSWGGGGTNNKELNYMKFDIKCNYSSSDSTVAADISEISAIYINGETIEVK